MEENLFGKNGLTIYGEPWQVVNSRNFTPEEINAIKSTSVIESSEGYGKSVCFMLAKGGRCYIPLSRNSDASLGSSINMNTAKLITLHRDGDADIIRVEL